MRNSWMIMLLVAAMTGIATAQVAQTQPAAANQSLADAVKKAEVAKDIDTALAQSKALEASFALDSLWAQNARRLPVLLWKAGQHTAAIAWLKDKAAALADDVDGLPDAMKISRSAAIVNACMDLVGREPDAQRRVELATVGMAVDPRNTAMFDKLFTALVAAGRPDDALQACLDYAGKVASLEIMRSRRMGLLATLKRGDDLRAESLEYLKVTTDPAAATRALAILLPADDQSLCCGLSAQQVVDGYKIMLRKRDGRLNAKTLMALAEQLTKGGGARPLSVTEDAKALAGKLTDAPLASFLVPLLTGDYAAAAKDAYGRAKSAGTDAQYVAWINAAAGAIRCTEQHYNGKALEFIKYVNGAIEANPVAEMVEP